MAISRSPLAYMERVGILPTIRPRPTFDVDILLIHQYDTGPSVYKSRWADGDPPPDRAELLDWVPPLERGEP
jgi:hypothetical protein